MVMLERHEIAEYAQRCIAVRNDFSKGVNAECVCQILRVRLVCQPCHGMRATHSHDATEQES